MKTVTKMIMNNDEYMLQPYGDANVHAKYFAITQDGVLSLKPEYRGAYNTSKSVSVDTYPDAISDNRVGVAGSKNGELPEYLVIPEVVDDVAVISFVAGLFYCNKAIKEVTLPKSVAKIPESCFNECLVEIVHGLEQVTQLGASAFRNSNLKCAWMPNLTVLGATAFAQCSMLTHVHIGKVTDIGADAFYKCRYLSRIESDGLVTAIGDTALMNTNRLVNANIPVENLASIGKGACIGTSWDADWSKLPDNWKKGDDSIWQQYNPTDFWSDCSVAPCSNPLPTLLTQWDERWIDKPLENNNTLTYDDKWKYGCQMFCYLHIYCGLKDLHLSHVDEFVDIVNGINPELMSNFRNNNGNVRTFFEGLGFAVAEYAEFNQSNLQALYDALNRGAYGMLVTGDGTADHGWMVGHAITAYGVTESGKLLIADSDYRYCNDRTSGVTYPVPYKTICKPKLSNGITFCVVSKPIAYSRYATIEDALAGTNMVDDGSVGAYSDNDGKYHVVLLADIASADTINIQRDCTLHLNGHTLEFTAAGAYLNIDTANEVVIDGTSIRSEKLDDGTTLLHKGTIKKNETTSTTAHQELIRTKGTNLTIHGGEYVLTNISAGTNAAKAIVAAVSNPIAKVALYDCSIVVSSVGQSGAYGVQVDDLVMHNCTLDISSVDGAGAGTWVYVAASIKNSTINVQSTGNGRVAGVNTYEGGSSCDIVNTDVHVTATGYNADDSNTAIGLWVSASWTVTIKECGITAARNGVDGDYQDTPLTKAIHIVNGGVVNPEGTNTFVPAYL